MASKTDRPLQITVFGATGFTGKYVVKDLKQRNLKGVTWAVAGRNEAKLRKVLEEVECPDVPVLVADVSDPGSLRAMCARTRVVISCVGPFQLYGEPLVKACIEAKCDYIDVTGEPSFMEMTHSRYHQQAVDAGVYIVSACGFDSIPNDLGVVYAEQQFSGELQCVESYLQLHSSGQGASIHSGTWESLIHSISNYRDVLKHRRSKPPADMPKSLQCPKRRFLFYSSEMAGWCLPFPGADRSVVARTQRFLFDQDRKSPVHFKPYVVIGSLCQSLGLLFYMGLIGVLSQISFFKNLFLNHPKFFTFGMISKEGPTHENLEKSSFSVKFYAHGFRPGTPESERRRPNSTLVTKVQGPDAGYIGTSHLLVESALTLLRNTAGLPPNGGVLTPGSTFGKSNLVENLNKTGKVTFKVVEEQK